MKYRVKVTHCISQLMNIKKFANAKFLEGVNDTYIVVDDVTILIIIEDIEMYMAAALKALKRLEALTEKQS